MFIRKREYEGLKRKLESAEGDASHYKNMYESYENNYMKANTEIENQKKKVEELQKKNEELQHKIDILYAYYDINKEPTQEERTKIRLDLRVHELEMENLELRAAVNGRIEYLRNELNRARLSSLNSIYQVPWVYYQLLNPSRDEQLL